MTPKELYPIDTQLITRRKSQAALYLEIFEEYPVALIEGEPHNFITYEKAYTWDHITNKLAVNHHYWFSDAWKVIVTEENQKWLSPVPMVGDLFEFKDQDSWLKSKNGDKHVIYRYIIDSPSMVEFLMREERLPTYLPNIETIVERKYPNNQRAPMLEWDEVILPTKGEQS